MDPSMPKGKHLPTDKYSGKGLTEIQWLLACHNTEHICGAEKRWLTELSNNNYNLPVFTKPFNFQENHVYYFIMVAL